MLPVKGRRGEEAGGRDVKKDFYFMFPITRRMKYL